MGEEGGARDPQNVVRVRVDPSVALIPNGTFYKCMKLTEVELCEGLVEMGKIPSRGATIQ
jgi:hypothetical protein